MTYTGQHIESASSSSLQQQLMQFEKFHVAFSFFSDQKVHLWLLGWDYVEAAWQQSQSQKKIMVNIVNQLSFFKQLFVNQIILGWINCS